MHESAIMEITEHIENWREYLPGFIGIERALEKNLREHFSGVVGDDVENAAFIHAIAAGLQNADEVGMIEASGDAPAGGAGCGAIDVGGKELDGGLVLRLRVDFAEKDAGVARASHPLEKAKPAIDDAADPILANQFSVHGSVFIVRSFPSIIVPIDSGKKKEGGKKEAKVQIRTEDPSCRSRKRRDP
jgi:hypothetical protein